MKPAFVLVLLLAVMLAGCSGDKAPDEADDGGGKTPRSSDGGSRTSDGGNETSEDPPHDDVLLLDAPFEGTGSVTMTYDVTVAAANLTNVDFSLHLTDAASIRTSVTASLDGCGQMQDTTISVASGGTTTLKARLCKSLGLGPATLTVTAQGLTFTGSVRLVGQVAKPVDNATAAA